MGMSRRSKRSRWAHRKVQRREGAEERARWREARGALDQLAFIASRPGKSERETHQLMEGLPVEERAKQLKRMR